MNQTIRIIVLVALPLVTVTTAERTAHAQQASTPHIASQATKGAHGGVLRELGEMTAESLLHPGGIKLFLYTPAGDAIAWNGSRGVVTLAVPGNAKRYRYDLFPNKDGSLSASVDLSKVAGQQVKLQFQTTPIDTGAGKRSVAFSELTVVPNDDDEKVAVAVARQQLCPVSGKTLGSMGKPVGVDIHGQKLFVCCAGCVEEVKTNPLKYADGRPKITVTSATEADKPLIAKQVKCPVMDEPLGSMGPPIKVQVGKQPVFLCCKGCVKKVKAEPAKYVAMVSAVKAKPNEKGSKQSTDASHQSVGKAAGQQVRPRVFRVTAADAQFVAAQKRCPVMDEPLDAMGGPYRVEADGRAIYICCPGCAKKIFAEPKTYLGILARQGVNAPLLR